MSTDTVQSGRDEPTSEFLDSIRSAIEGLEDSASVERVFGDPIAAEGKTFIPVARVAYGFGSGFGSGTDTTDEEVGEEAGGTGGGGGGGLSITPVGVLEVTDDESSFVRFANWKRTGLAIGAGVVLGILLGRR